MLIENIRKTYKKTTVSLMNSINTEAKAIGEDLKLDEWIEQCNRNKKRLQWKTTLKDYNENFQNNPKYRLINPAKSEIGIVSKHYISHINKSVREKLNVHQWRNTEVVITWFRNIKTNGSSTFIKFDIADFYPSISKDLLLKVISFAKSITSIQDKLIETILHSRKARLFNKNDVCVKKKW